MSRSTIPLEIIYAGVHLVVPSEVLIIRDKDNLPFVNKDGTSGISITFSEGTNGATIDHAFWLPSAEFAKFCKELGVDPSKKIRKQLIGKSLWICVKEIKTMVGDKHLKSNYKVFDFIECDDPTVPPEAYNLFWDGDINGDFVEYVQDEIEKYKSGMGSLSKLKSVPLDFASDTLVLKASDGVIEKLAIGRKIIAEGEKKEMTSLNQKNKPSDDWDDL